MILVNVQMVKFKKEQVYIMIFSYSFDWIIDSGTSYLFIPVKNQLQSCQPCNINDNGTANILVRAEGFETNNTLEL